ncbi:MAG: mechanosensitive ion channel domain-containing protein [Mucilaginibacter sp.]|uniref:mechanosensitive ion channel domain-containing protein n=1 Tax=Mucilaginibacter sp. TaxID=1882438 RepID=UPI003265F774
MKYLFCLQLLSCFLLRSAFAQQDTIQRKQDSLLTIKLEQQQKKVKQLSEDRLADSLKRTDLQKQLSTADNMQKGQLLQKLEALRQKDSLRTIKQKHQIDSLRAFVKGFPVVPFRDTLFFLFTRQGSFTAKDRAEAVSKRINILSAIYAFKGDSLKITPTEQTTDILFRDQLLISISDQDALWQHTSREALAAKIKAQIGEAVTSHQQETRWQTILVEALLALLVVIVTILLIYGLNRLFRWLHKKLAHQTGWFNKGIHIKGYELLNAENELALIGKALVVLKWAIILLIVYLALPILFGIFPFTRDVSDKLLNYFISPLKKIAHALWDYIPNLMTILVLLVVFRYVLKFVKFITTEIEKGQLKVPGFYADWANPTYQIVRVLVLAFMLIVIFPYLPGSDSGVFKGVSVFMGVLFTFGSAGALGNVVAGLVLTYMRAFKIGDRVQIGEVTGDVIEKTLLVTRVRTIQNEIISIPNSTVMSNHTINYSSDAPVNGLIMHTMVTIGYDVPWRQVHQLLIDAALETPMIEAEPKPYVLQTSLDDYYVSYRINAFTKQPNRQAVIYSGLHANIQDFFNKAGVEIMSPHYKALRDGNATTIPADYLPKNYVAPGFVTDRRKPDDDEISNNQ